MRFEHLPEITGANLAKEQLGTSILMTIDIMS
jgi:hypothetical protein